MIEDALDISRLENNKFELFKEVFNFKQTYKDVCDIMRFQFEQKGIELNLKIDPNVPTMIKSDGKRIK